MIDDEYRTAVARGLREGARVFEPFDGDFLFASFVFDAVDPDREMDYKGALERLADLVESGDARCSCIDCEYGMVPNCYGVYCRCLARYMEPDGFCSLAKRRTDR